MAVNIDSLAYGKPYKPANVKIVKTMPNDMRDRLLKVIENAFSEPCASNECYQGLDIYNANCVSCFTDYLIENGVILPPCKVGDTVYYINTFFPQDPRINKCKVDALHITTGKNQLGHNKPSYALVRDENMSFLSTTIYFDKFGKTVFLTKEEAENALRGWLNDNKESN